MSLPTLPIAVDVDVSVSIASPGMHGHDEAMTCIAEPRLQLTSDVPGEKVARDVGSPKKYQPRLPFASSRPSQRVVQGFHGLAVAILDPDIQPQLVVGRRLKETRPHTLSRLHGLDDSSLVDRSGRRRRRVGRRSGSAVAERPRPSQRQPRRNDRQRRAPWIPKPHVPTMAIRPDPVKLR